MHNAAPQIYAFCLFIYMYFVGLCSFILTITNRCIILNSFLSTTQFEWKLPSSFLSYLSEAKKTAPITLSLIFSVQTSLWKYAKNITINHVLSGNISFPNMEKTNALKKKNLFTNTFIDTYKIVWLIGFALCFQIIFFWTSAISILVSYCAKLWFS